MPQSLRARAMSLKTQANKQRSDWSNPHGHHWIGLVQIVVVVARHSPSSEIARHGIASSLPQPSGLPTWLLPPSWYFIFDFTKLTSLSFSL